MTHRTVPLDLLVRVRDALSLAANGLRHCSRWNISDEKSQAILTHVGTLETLIAELTAQIEQPQDSVPAWAMELVAQWRSEILRPTGIMDRTLASCADELESRALALAQTKG